MAKEKTTGFFFKMSPEEWALVERRMEQTGIRNKSAFIRKMCIDGHVINLDIPVLGEIKRLLGITANNVNQIARRVNAGSPRNEVSWGENSGGEAYREDIAELNENILGLRSDFGQLLSVLSEVANAKPGKRFLRPLTVRDLPECSSSGEDV